MNFCLDTSSVIGLSRDRDRMAEVVGSLDKQDLYITVITIGELEVGYFYDEDEEGRRKRDEFYRFADELRGIWGIKSEVAVEFGRIKADLKRRNQLIGDNDTWIAAICKVNKATLVTANREHFGRVKGLKVV